MKDPDQMVTWLPAMNGDLRERFAAYEEPVDLADRYAADPARRLVSLGFIWAALRRRVRFWGTLAIVGMLIGAAAYVVISPAQKATASVLLADDPTANPTVETQVDMALAESVPVATAVVRQLGLQQTPNSFLSTYTATSTVAQLVTITASAPTSDEAVQRAATIAAQFLKFRAQYEQTQLRQTAAQLNNQVSQARQRLNSLSDQVSQVSSQTAGPAQQAQLVKLQNQRSAASVALLQVQQNVTTTLSSAQTLTADLVNGSRVLNQAYPVRKSLVKTVGLYAGGGLIGGLALGIAIVVIGAVTSDRLRRRDDIAYAAGAPVRLSVGSLRKNRWLPGSLGRARTRRRDIERVVEHLRNVLPASSNGPAALAVVAVDDAHTVASTVVALAGSLANGRKVVLADLSAGLHAARLLGAARPGVHEAGQVGERIVVVVPAADDVAPAGPLKDRAIAPSNAWADESVIAACADADILLSLVTLDPACGGDHLATWASEVVAVITAGRSTATRIHAAGDMIRIGGLSLGSIVVIDADKSDESLGATSPEHLLPALET